MQELLKEKDLLKISDLALCTALCYFGYKVEAVDRKNPAKVIFLIKRDGEIDDLIRLYFAHELKVEPLNFFNCLKEIKNRIYNL